MKKYKINRIFIILIAIVILVVFDRISKIWAESALLNNSVDIIRGVFNLELLPGGNKGAAWGVLSGHQLFFIIIATTVCCGLLFIMINLPDDKKYTPVIIFMTLIISGGIGNMIDRAIYGTVTDFINFYIINFPYFNVADMYVSVGTVLLIFFFLFIYKENDIKDAEDAVISVIKRKQ